MFNSPGGIMWHPNGSLFVGDILNHSIRRIDFVSTGNSDAAELFLTLNPALTIFGTPGTSYRIRRRKNRRLGRHSVGRWWRR